MDDRMKLFIWDRSQLLHNYADGTIIVLAADAEQARALAAAEFQKWIRERYDHWFEDRAQTTIDPLFQEDYDRACEQFEKDMAEEPLVDRDVLFIPGSN
jgi:hypothetical protein